ncbi:hypothetical protein ACA910_014898 [Epithemia clementina (nom. ined.)]
MSTDIRLINEESICLIHSMNYKDAAHRLSEGIDMIEQDHTTTGKNEDQRYCDDVPMIGADDDHANIDTFLVECSCQEDECRAAIPGDNLSSFALFDNALSIPQHLSPQRDRDYTVICCILLYNYGLSLHLQGMSTGSENNLEEALLSYEMALGLVALIDQGRLVSVLELALLNNCSHIHSFHSATSHVHSCLQRMHTLLMTLYASRHVSQEQLAPFAFNVVYNACQFKRPAPAA